MALVRISKQLIEDIRNRIRVMSDAEQKNIEIPPTAWNASVRTDVQEFVTACKWGDKLHLKEQMPHHWLAHAKNVEITVKYSTPSPRAVEISYTDMALALPPGTNLNWNSTLQLVVRPEDLPELSQLKAEVEALHAALEQRAEIAKAWISRRDDIVKFLEKCKSLNEALKLWPGIKLYVPTSYIETIERKVERATPEKRAEVVATIDTDGLTAAAIAAKLAGVLV